MAVFLKTFTLFTTHNNHIYIDMFTFVKQTLIWMCNTGKMYHQIRLFLPVSVQHHSLSLSSLELYLKDWQKTAKYLWVT